MARGWPCWPGRLLPSKVAGCPILRAREYDQVTPSSADVAMPPFEPVAHRRVPGAALVEQSGDAVRRRGQALVLRRPGRPAVDGAEEALGVATGDEGAGWAIAPGR